MKVTLSPNVVYLLCKTCPTCNPVGRTMLELGRKAAYQRKRSFMVVMQGNMRWRQLMTDYAQWKVDHPSEADYPLPAYYWRGQWFWNSAKLEEAMDRKEIRR